MTRKLEEEFNLPSLDEALRLSNEHIKEEELLKIQEAEQELEEFRKEDYKSACEFEKALLKSKELENELVDHEGLKEHDVEMNEVSSEAMNAYHQLMDLGANVTPAHAGKLYETAANMLRVALDARNSKSDKKLKMWRLQLDQARLQRDLERDKQNSAVNEEGESVRITIDRNKLLNELKDI